ncbi:MAG: DUF4007 family protein [Candidatus Onthomorpha sp.]|nr:DUF4007 family protein [Bacteroidales bacterium]MDD7484492.1 DUF4007 family protein [Bacteroidales bacterium]MDY5699111.1 DUF4007 family protein [Candidatus Onthomorpha sp.]
MEFNCDNKAHFSGHETFVCKSLWLKKGYDFVKEHHSFNDDDAVVYLGVGKNMVASIRYWLLSFGLMNQDNKISPFADYIFSTETGCDPFVEDNQTLWLLHWSLVYTNYATIYRQLFCDFHRERKEFSKSNILAFLRRKNFDKSFSGIVWNDNTISKDISTLIRMYVTANTNVCDDYSSILINLNLIKLIEKDLYDFNYSTKSKINPLIFFYAVHKLSNGSQVVEFDKMQELSRIFCLSQSELFDIFSQLTAINSNITFDNSAGEQLFTIRQDFNEYEILDMYYKKR